MPGLRVCAEPRCTVLSTQDRCQEHRQVVRRFATGQTHYGLKRWRSLREQVLQAQPMCRIRGSRCTLVSEEVDHIVPHRGDEQLMYDRTNLQGACKSCHSQKTAAELRHRTRGGI